MPSRSLDRGLAAGFTLCLVLAILAALIDLPIAVRAVLGVPAILVAPGYAWVSAARARTGASIFSFTAAVLAVVVSLALTALTGVTLQALGLSVTPVNVCLGLLGLTAPPATWLWKNGAVRDELIAMDGTAHKDKDDIVNQRRGGGRTTLVGLCSVTVFVVAVAWGASWQHRADTGPYTTMNFAGQLEKIEGPITARPKEALSIPIQVRRSDGMSWNGRVVVQVDGVEQLTQAVKSNGAVMPLPLIAPDKAGLYFVTIIATRNGTGERLQLTLRIRVSQG